MEFLKTHFEQIRQHLGQLSTSAKMAVILLAIIVTLSLAWIVSAAASPERVAVFDAQMAGDELIRAEQIISRQGIDVEVSNGQLMVPEDARMAAIAALASEEIAGPAGSPGLLELALSSSPFTTKDQSDRIWGEVEQARMSQFITAFPKVKRAQVILKVGSPGGIGRRHVAPTASVHLVMRSGQVTDPRMRRAIADQVSGAVPGLKRSDVRIVDSTNGRSFTASEDGGGDDEKLEAIQQWQTYCERNVRSALGEIPNVLVAVFPVPDTTQSVQTKTLTYADPVLAKIEAASEETTNAGPTAAEPGANANTSARLPSVATVGSSSERSESASAARFGETRKTTLEGRSVGLKDVTVSVSVPRSHLVRVFRSKSGNDETSEPTDSDLDGLLARIGDRVRPALGIEDDKQMNVDWYVGGEPEVVQVAAQAGVLPTIIGNGKSVALGTLAVLALGMVMMFARRRAPEPPSFDSDFTPEGLLDTTVGAVDGSEGALEGIELDEDAIRSQRVVDQVGEMVRERPDSAANLVRRWIEQK